MELSDMPPASTVNTLIPTLAHGPADARHRTVAQLADLGTVALAPVLDLVTQADRQHLGWILDGIAWEDREGQTADPSFDLLTAPHDEPFWYLAAVTRLIQRLGREASPTKRLPATDAVLRHHHTYFVPRTAAAGRVHPERPGRKVCRHPGCHPGLAGRAGRRGRAGRISRT